MASGFCVSMLLLSLIAFGLLAVGNAYMDGHKSLGPYSAQAETLPRSYRPVPSGYEAALQPRTSVAYSQFPGSLSAETSKLFASKGQSGYGRQVNSYSQPRSVSSYRSASAMNPQQQPQDGLYQWKPRTSEPSSSQGEKRYGSSIVSSGAIVIRAPENPPQLQSSSTGISGLQTKPGTWDRVPASQIPNLHPAFSVPAVLQTNAGMWDSVNAQSAKSPESAARRPLQNLAFSAPSMQPADADRWRNVFAQSAKAPDSTTRHEDPLPDPGVLKTSPGHLHNSYSSSVRSPDFTSQRHEKLSSFSAPAVLQTKPGMWDRVPASQIPNLHPAFSVPAVLQTNAGMWDSVNAQSAKSPESAARRPLQNLAFSAPSMQPADADRWRNVFAQSAKAPDSTTRHEDPLPDPGVLKTSPGHLHNFYSSSVRSPDFTSQRHEKPSSFSAPAVLQTKHGMWGSVFSPDSSKKLPANPRSSGPLALGYYSSRLPSGLPGTQQQAKLLASQPMRLGSPASSVLQNKAVLKDFYSNPQIKHDPRRSRPVNVASSYQHGSWQPQLSYNRN